MVKGKKIDIRVNEKIFNDLQAVSWFLGKKRSDLVRSMIEYSFDNAHVKVNGETIPFRHAIAIAFEKMIEENKTIEDLIMNRETNKELPSKLEEELARFADYYAKQAIKAYKKHTKEGEVDEAKGW